MSRRSTTRKTARRRTGRARKSSADYSRSARLQFRRRPRLEALEDRRLLAVVTVDTLADTVDVADGVTSLREAIFATNTVGGEDTIRFDSALTANGPATILLTQGELAVTDSLTINGPGADVLTIDASGNDPTPDANNGDGSRIFRIDDGGATVIGVSLSGLRIAGGDTKGGGGAVLSFEDVHIVDVVLEENSVSSSIQPGIIYSAGTLTIERSRIANNKAVNGHGIGGVIVSHGLTMRESEISDNRGTGGLFSSGATLIADCTIARNDGIGVQIKTQDDVQIIRTTISDHLNRGVGGLWFTGGGTVLVSESTIARNFNFNGEGGGGAYFNNLGGDVTIDSSLFIENRASSGAGVLVQGNLSVVNSEFRDNVASFAGGGFAASQFGGFGADLVIEGSTFFNNAAFRGGAIHLRSPRGNAALYGNRIVGNTASEDGGGIYIDSTTETVDITDTTFHANNAGGYGGGIWVAASFPAQFRIDSNTIDANTARLGGGGIALTVSPGADASILQATFSGNSTNGNGGGMYLGVDSATVIVAESTFTLNGFGAKAGGGISAIGNGKLLLTHSIVADNFVLSSSSPDIDKSLSQLEVSFSIIGNSSGTTLTPSPIGSPDATGNLIGGTTKETVIDPRLRPLADNGGPTMTHAPLAGSPAINAGDPNAAAGANGTPEFDQRGAPFGRVFGGRIDMGAVEFQPVPLPGDFDGDRVVGNGDLTLLLNHWAEHVPPISVGWSGIGPTGPAVDNDELTLLLNHWGTTAGGVAEVRSAITAPITALAEPLAPDLKLAIRVEGLATPSFESSATRFQSAIAHRAWNGERQDRLRMAWQAIRDAEINDHEVVPAAVDGKLECNDDCELPTSAIDRALEQLTQLSMGVGI